MRALVAILMLLAMAPASAGWIVIDHSRDGTVDYYLDPSTIESNGSIKKVTELQNHPKGADQLGLRSKRIIAEYDCKLNKYRYLSAWGYEGEMAEGRELRANKVDGPWMYVPSYTFVQLAKKYVCSQ